MKNKVKNRETTKRKLVDAVGYIIEKDGFDGLGVNKVAKLADTSKILIYRYFESFEQLLKAYILRKDFWTNYQMEHPQLWDVNLPLFEMINKILSENFTEFYNHCEMEALLIYEISNHNEMVMNIVREECKIDHNTCYDVISTLLLAGTDHLILDIFENGKNKQDPEIRKQALRKSIDQILDWTFK